jgi:orotate phosphoribosyltransferase
MNRIEELRAELAAAESAATLEWLRREIEHRAVYRVRPGEPGILGKAPNTRYTWQIYLRRVMMDPQWMWHCAHQLHSRLPAGPRQFAACEDAGVPLAQALATLDGQPWISVKKERKKYGLHNWTEGRTTGAPIVLVDDVAGSQATLRSAASKLRAFKLPVANYYVTILNKTQGTHAENYLANTQLISLFTCDDIAMSWKAYAERHGREPDFGPIY